MKAQNLPTPLTNDDDDIVENVLDETLRELSDAYHLDITTISLVSDVVAQSIRQSFDDGLRNPAFIAQCATAHALRKLGRKFH